MPNNKEVDARYQGWMGSALNKKSGGDGPESSMSQPSAMAKSNASMSNPGPAVDAMEKQPTAFGIKAG